MLTRDLWHGDVTDAAIFEACERRNVSGDDDQGELILRNARRGGV